MNTKTKSDRTQMFMMCYDFIIGNLIKTPWSAICFFIVAVILLLSSCKDKQGEHNTLNEHKHPGQHNHSAIDTLVQIISPNKQVLSRQATVKLSAQSEIQIVESEGYIDLDRSRSRSVSARFGGRIEKLFVKYDFQFVKMGDRILELYSPELNTFQEEHLFLLKSEGEELLKEQSRQKLRLLGITESQISQLEKNGTFAHTITVYSPANGYVFFDAETVSSTNASQQTAMSAMSIEPNNNTGEIAGSSGDQIREGVYVSKGETMFSVNDLQNVWAIISISPQFHSVLLKNRQVKIISELFPDKQLTGKIALVEQAFEENNQRFVRVRVELPNHNGQLNLNSLLRAEIPLETNGSFQIPASAVYHTGLSSFVWVKTGITQSGTGMFQLRKVRTGAATNRMISVISGLSANEEVAENVGYLTDSETFLDEN
ncbi:efflux RND transporter periplasmic adaptor subunit [Flavitalea antarctica]